MCCPHLQRDYDSMLSSRSVSELSLVSSLLIQEFETHVVVGVFSNEKRKLTSHGAGRHRVVLIFGWRANALACSLHAKHCVHTSHMPMLSRASSIARLGAPRTFVPCRRRTDTRW